MRQQHLKRVWNVVAKHSNFLDVESIFMSSNCTDLNKQIIGYLQGIALTIVCTEWLYIETMHGLREVGAARRVV